MGKRIVVVGGGIAGVSVAYALALHPDRPAVTVIEAEPTLAFHTTGRSAAQLILGYGAPPTRALSEISRSFLAAPPPGLTDAPLLSPRPQLTVATSRDDAATQEQAIDELLSAGTAYDPEEISVKDAVVVAPLLRPEHLHRAALDRHSADIDVAGLHQAFVRGVRAAGGSIRTEVALISASHASDGWTIALSSGEQLQADDVVNAAGAWGDVVARRCGVEPVGLMPLRRTAFMVSSPWHASDSDSSSWPLVADAIHSWYCKPDGAQFLCSPADEVPDTPRDAKPEELDVAMAIDRINTVTRLEIRSVASAWAGLRTFGPDRSMVLGPDPGQPSFHWCVGQGGTGIQTSPAAGQLVADLAMDGAPSQQFDQVDLQLDGLLPDRLR